MTRSTFLVHNYPCHLGKVVLLYVGPFTLLYTIAPSKVKDFSEKEYFVPFTCADFVANRNRLRGHLLQSGCIFIQGNYPPRVGSMVESVVGTN